MDIPGRADRRHAEAEAAGALDHHGLLLAVDQRRAVDRRLERVRVRDGVRVPPRREARHHDHDEARERDERDAVAQQAAARERPGAAADDAGRLAHVADRHDDLRPLGVARALSLLDPGLTQNIM